MREYHGDSKISKLYVVWDNIKQRCFNPNHPSYNNYGGRGITICDEWLKYSVFKEWALSSGYGKDLSIDRIDNDGNYKPSNCQWLSVADNTRKSGEKFIADEVIEIRKIIKHGGYSNRRIARAYGVDHATIDAIANNKTYKEAI